jgi:tRNA threonylcarbamoyl adenosine modification protein YjeE
MSTITKTTTNAAETQALAYELVNRIGPAPIIALYGDLGAGKTCFVQGLASALGIKAAVCSPTFTIVNEYIEEGSPRKRLIHADLYRLSGPEELETIGWDDYIRSGDAMAVEWPDRAEGEFPPNLITIDIRIGDTPDERIFNISLPDDQDAPKQDHCISHSTITEEVLQKIVADPNTKVLQGGRNLTVRANVKLEDGTEVEAAIKRFPPRSPLRCIIELGKQTKAAKSFRAAEHLFCKVGNVTPEPLALIDNGPAHEGWFVSKFEQGITTFGQELIKLYNSMGPSSRLMELLQLVAEKCAAMHDSGFMHRDLGNQNIMLSKRGVGNVVMFIDLNRSRSYNQPLTNKQRARDISRINLPSDLLRVFIAMYWRGSEPPVDFLKWENRYRRSYARHCMTRDIRHPIRRLKKKPSPDGVYPSYNDIWIWDTKSEQAIPVLKSKDRRKYQSSSRVFMSLLGIIKRAKKIKQNEKFIRSILYSQPILNFANRLFISISGDPHRFAREQQLLSELGCTGVHIRFYFHEGLGILKEKCGIVQTLSSAGYKVAITLVQNREAVLNPEKWSEFGAQALKECEKHIYWVQVGQAINRSKWGCWNYKEAARLFEPIAEWKKAYPNVKFIGPSLIDYEWDYLVGLLECLPKQVHFNAACQQLYVDRRGAPENKQGKAAAIDKLVKIRAITNTSKQFGEQLIVSEFNWPLLGTREWSPVGSPYVVHGVRTNDPSVTERDAAIFALRYVFLGLASGATASMVYWSLAAHGFGLVDPGVDEEHNQQQWRKRPAFIAFSVFFTLLKDAHFIRQIQADDSNKVWVLEFKDSNEKHIVVGWTSDALADRPMPKLDFEIKTVVDTFGKTIDVPGKLLTDPVYYIGK